MLPRHISRLAKPLRLIRCLSSTSENDSSSSPNPLLYLGIGSASLGAYFWYKKRHEIVYAASDGAVIPRDLAKPPAIPQKEKDKVAVDRFGRELPVLKRAEVARHTSRETGVWVTYKGGVYDITEFIDSHPGGEKKILLAAGGPLEPFWSIYAQHKTDQVMEMLEEMQIGNLDPKEVGTEVKDDNDPFAHDPERHPALVRQALTPFNAETPSSLLADDFHTPNDLFYVRNHLPVPKVNLEDYRLSLGKKEFKLEDLKRKFKPVTITAALQCAGNRRDDLTALKETKGLQWGLGAIGNAQWTGVRLTDVLKAAGVNLEKAKHVHFQGLDKDMSGDHYETSIPIRKALEEEVILAYEMNGQPLPPDHGFPLRLIAPGLVGARQVKWVARIGVGEEESGSHWQKKDYRVFSPSADIAQVDFNSAPAIQEAPVISAICSPSPNDTIDQDSDTVEVKGYAWSGGGRGIVRVEVSVDGGRSWTCARLQQNPQQSLERMWAWTLWEAEVPLPPSAKGSVELLCKATDVSYNVQPDTPLGIWNFRGLLNNSWHRVRVPVAAD